MEHRPHPNFIILIIVKRVRATSKFSVLLGLCPVRPDFLLEHATNRVEAAGPQGSNQILVENSAIANRSRNSLVPKLARRKAWTECFGFLDTRRQQFKP